MESIELNSDVVLGYIYTYGMNVVGALFTLVIGLWVANTLVDFIKRLLNRSKVDPSLQSFLSSLFGILFKIMVYITALGVLGVEMTSFIALLGAAGLAVGLALSGTLQNFAGGVMILFFKTFKVGDFIEAQGYSGTVKEIQIFVSILTTPDNKTVIVPNGPLATGTLVNFSTQPIRRVDWTFGIAYGDDVDKAYAVLKDLVSRDARILVDPAPLYAVGALADSSVNIVTRVWVNAADYWPVFFAMNEQVYKHFAKAGLTIPFPQRDVHIHQEK
ncbi:MAG: mechanosensitive ion channel [Gammaproteobacteria bacterium]|nr:mechanosensitive ion channel [Gammaproteobacteria bacterium]MDP2141467.1 mechanosensitive ion channel [Gammaproteobacteria bacterium]MDP2347508.1 mechanosensitive ion channel [Gammaproteobacteria bacterium]